MEEQIELVHTLRRVLRRKAMDEMEVASEFAGQHRDLQLIGERNLDTYKGYYSLLVGEDATVEWSETGDSVGKDNRGRWVFGLHQYDGASAAMHEAAHAMFSPLDYTQKVAELLSNKYVHLVANVIEDRRIEFLADVWWRGANIYEKHRAELIRGGEEALRNSVDYQHMGGVPIYTRDDHAGHAWHEWAGSTLADDQHNSGGGLTKDKVADFLQRDDWLDTAVAIQVQLITYDLPGVVIDPTVQAVAKRFRQKILDAGCSLDRNAALRVAVEIGNFMNWHAEKHPEPEPRGGGGEPCEDGEEETTPQPGNGPPEPSKDTDGDDPDTGSPPPPPPPPPPPEDTEPEDTNDEPADGDSDDGDDADQAEGGGEADTDEDEDDGDGPGPEPTMLDKLLEQAEQQVSKEILRKTAETANKQALDNRTRRERIKLPGSHEAVMTELKTEPIPPDARVKAMLDSMHESSFNARPQISGTVTPKVWQIRHGNMKVFRQLPKRRGRTLIFVDCSGSMGCPCPRCYRGNTAPKAWQIAGALAKATGNAEVYAFGGQGSHVAGIGKVPVGHQPTCRREPDMTGINKNEVGASTPICAALVYAEQSIHGAENTTTMVFITDGDSDDNACTYQQAARLHDAGVDFIAVNLGRHHESFPSDVTVTLTKDDDYSDIGSLSPAIRHIRGK